MAAAGKGRSAHVERVNEVIPKMIRSLGMNNKYKAQLIFFYWQKIVGEAIAAQASPADISFGTLVLTARSSVWANNLLMMKLDLIAKINRFVGDTVIKDIRFRGYSWQEEAAEEAAPVEEENIGRTLRRMALEEQEISQARAQCDAVRDDVLRQQLLRLYQKNLKLKKLEMQRGWHPCKVCAVLCPPESEYCAVCDREARQAQEAQIREILANMPWARYGDIYKYIPCSPDMVNQQRVKMMQKAAAKVDPNHPDSLEAKTLVMLYRCLPPEQLTEEIITKTLHRLRNDLRQSYIFQKKENKRYAKKEKK